MKNMILILSFFFLITGCEKEKETDPQENSIYGTWQLIKRTSNNADGSPNDWVSVSDGYSIIFDSRFSYSSSQPPVCSSNPSNTGTYKIDQSDNNNYVIISYLCEENDLGSFDLKYLYSFNQNNLILVPTFSCDEGCASLFSKIN